MLFFIQHSIVVFILLGFAILFVLFQKDVLPFLAQKYLKEFNVEYSSLEGTLFHGVVVHDFSYEKSIKAKKLTIKYNFLSLLQPTPRIDFVDAEAAFIDLDALLASLESDDESSALAPFNISEIKLKNSTLHYADEMIFFDIEAFDLGYRESLDIEKIDLNIKTKYADADFKGSMKEYVLRGKSSFLPSKEVREKYIDFLEYSPKRVSGDIEINSKKINFIATLKSMAIKDFSDFSIEDAAVNFSYFIQKNEFVFDVNYKARYGEYEAALSQAVLVDGNLKVTSELEAKIVNENNNLPFDVFSMTAEYDENSSHAHFSAKELEIDALTYDFKKFIIDADTLYAKFDAEILKDSNEIFIESNIYPKEEFLHYEGYDLKRFSKFKLSAHEKNSNVSLFLKSDIFSISLFGNEAKADGYANIGSAFFDYRVDLKNKKALIDTRINSVHTLMKELNVKELGLFFDAKVEAKSEINFSDIPEVRSSVYLPSYALKLDSKRSFFETENRFEFFYKEGELTLKNYNFGVPNRRIYSNRSSKVFLNADGEVELREFWIYDALLLQGLIKTSDMSADFRLKGDNFHYESKDANVTLRVNLNGEVEPDGKMHVDGAIEITDGTIMYKPRKDYSISDEDIIIIQDIKEYEQRNNIELNILVTSTKPLPYKVEDISLLVTPNLLLYQEMGSFLQIFGVLNIKSGEVTLSDKIFEFDASEIYFYGGKEANPHLNLNLHYYTTDYIDIEIYITNTMNSPLVLFSSKPAMSQDDILSYILFGESASSVFNTTSDGSSKTSLNTLLLGTGLKKMVNESTNVKVDALNILTNKEGTLGYEIGARFNKNIRIVYKNDEISSLILQYSLSKSIRIDVDVKETGQGVSIIYVKDFGIK